jgi:hypothetical protein
MTLHRCRVVLAFVVAVALAGVSVLAHITPVVVLEKQADVIRSTLAGATGYFVTEVRIGRDDLARIRAAGHFTPQDENVKFYSGKDAQGQTVGVVLFPQLDTPHGPIEIGLTVDPGGAVVSVRVTRATAETKPWVEQVIRSGGLDRLRGVEHAADAASALDVGTLHLDSMPAYFADVIATAVAHGLVLYRTLYAPSTPSAAHGGTPANFLPRVTVE